MSGLWKTLKVAAKKREADDIVSFELIDPAGEPLPRFTAGAHIDIEIVPGLVRQYSLCNDPREQHRYLIGVLREPASRGGSATLVDTVVPGALVPTSEPRNHFALDPSATRVVLMAGGIGITPILCMAEQSGHHVDPIRAALLHKKSCAGGVLGPDQQIAILESDVLLFRRRTGIHAARFKRDAEAAGPGGPPLCLRTQWFYRRGSHRARVRGE